MQLFPAPLSSWQEKTTHTSPGFYFSLSISKADFFFFFFFFFSETMSPWLRGLRTTKWTCTPPRPHTSTPRTLQISRLVPIWITLKTYPSPLSSCRWMASDVWQPCIRQKLNLNPQICSKEQQNSTRADWIKINSLKNTLTVYILSPRPPSPLFVSTYTNLFDWINLKLAKMLVGGYTV